jgi:hypothetical protein
VSYKLKPQTFEAMQYTGTNGNAMETFAPSVCYVRDSDRKLILKYPAVGSDTIMQATTWLVQGPEEFWEYCRDQYFQKKYELV